MGEDVTAMGTTVTTVGDNSPEKKELKKHAATIHCSNTLSLLQRKITNALLYHAYKELLLKEEHEISVKQLCRLIGYQGHNHAAIREAFKGLISTVIEWNVINDVTGQENWTASSIIASVSLEGPMCYYAYSPRMKQLLHSPSMFGKIDLVIQSKFRSSYGLALYENCIRYRGLPYTKWFEIALFRKLMGVPEGMYEIFRDFKRRVLDKAVEEVNMYSDLFVEQEMIKEGKRVARIRFLLKERAKKKRLGVDILARAVSADDVKEEVINKLKSSFHLTDSDVAKLFRDYDLNFIQKKINLIEQSKSYQSGKIKKLKAYLLSALKNDYQEAEVFTHNLIQIKANRQHNIELLKNEVEKVRQAYLLYREQTIESAFKNLPFGDQDFFLERFFECAQETISTVLKVQRRKYNKKNILTSPQVRAAFRQFIIREIDILPLWNVEEFLAEQPIRAREAWQKLKSLDPENSLLHFQD